MPTGQSIAQKIADAIQAIQPQYFVVDGGKALVVKQGKYQQKLAIQPSQASDRAIQSR